MEIPETRYADAGGISIAYQLFGTGPVNVVAVPPAASCVEMVWDWPPAHHYFERWGAFARVAHFDKRGTGYSDRMSGAPSVEERMDDIRAVMDAAGFERAVIFGLSEGGPLSTLFAATYPERTIALVLQGTFARMPHDEEASSWFIDQWAQGWGTPDSITGAFFVPSQQGNEEYALYLRRYERAAATPAALRTLMRLNLEIDVQPALPLIACPTLVVHASGDLLIPVRTGRELAEAIPGALFAEYDSPDHFPMLTGVDDSMDIVEEFLTGELPATPTDRVLATVLFTDIVGSTAHAAELGDSAWHAALDRHEHTMRRVLAEHRGTLVNTTGDGLVATFDSPARGIRCARALCDSAAALALPIRAGVHTGEIERRGNDIAGIAVHIGARIAALACAGEVLVSVSVPPLVAGSGITFTDRGEHQLRGVPGDWRVYAVT